MKNNNWKINFYFIIFIVVQSYEMTLEKKKLALTREYFSNLEIFIKRVPIGDSPWGNTFGFWHNVNCKSGRLLNGKYLFLFCRYISKF